MTISAIKLQLRFLMFRESESYWKGGKESVSLQSQFGLVIQEKLHPLVSTHFQLLRERLH